MRYISVNLLLLFINGQMRSNVKVYLQDSVTVDNFPTICLFVTKLG